MSCLAAALEFVRLGLAVLPLHSVRPGGDKLVCTCGNAECSSAGKHPIAELAPHGHKDASCDERVVARWFKHYPDANLGLRTGAIVVVDVDPRHRGDVTLANFEQQHGPLPLTWRSITGGAGLHAFFAAPVGGIASGRLGWGVDFKSSGGYVVAPPSRHVSGRHYVWEADPRDVPLAPLPQWIIETLRRPKAERRPHRPIKPDKIYGALRGIIRAIAHAPRGERNNLAYWGACRLLELADQQVITREEAIGIAIGAATRSGLPYVEATRTARSAISRGQS
jgi:Bifunctional DNA primase/polymerase, N-terminal